ncbi:MAG: hypothetical protein GY761_03045, partial [Hyphomicrobiales bacterium]|nr:hypothetical protein [Hyphomicrobiales bacterium]
MMILPILTTERLQIRPFIPSDLQNAHQLYREVDWIDMSQTPDEQLAARRLYTEWNALNHVALTNLTQPPTGDRIVELQEGGEFMGLCGINTIWLPMTQLPMFGAQKNSLMQPEASLMWAILPEYQG